MCVGGGGGGGGGGGVTPKLVNPDHLRLPQLVPPSPGGIRTRARARPILISTYASCIDEGWTVYVGGPPMA